jgi:thiol-disulfide isomerase/thioredoxin
MHRLFSFFVLLFFAATQPVRAEKAKDTSSPPISGDMIKLTLINSKEQLPRVVLSSADKGLTYLSDYKGKIVVLNIWAKWCAPCLAELPSLNALQMALGGSYLQVVTVSIDTDSLTDIKKTLTDMNLNELPGFADNYKNIQQLEVLKGVAGVPITLIIDPQTRVLAMVEGDADWNGPDARKVLEYYMKNVSYSLFE